MKTIDVIDLDIRHVDSLAAMPEMKGLGHALVFNGQPLAYVAGCDFAKMLGCWPALYGLLGRLHNDLLEYAGAEGDEATDAAGKRVSATLQSVRTALMHVNTVLMALQVEHPPSGRQPLFRQTPPRGCS